MAVYGIDFGTCYSCIAVADSDKDIEVVPSSRNENTVPSVVMFNPDGRPVIGRAAKNAFTRPDPRNVVAYIKTMMHQEQTDAEYEVTRGERRHMSPVEVASCIYYDMFSHANLYRRGRQLHPATQAVITVPAVCTDIQREKTKIAAELAGIQVLKVISEPTAAAISYNISAGETVMIFDLGGGTLDVSIIHANALNDYEVWSCEGNNELGGRQWDMTLLALCYENLGLQYDPAGISTKQLVNMESFKIDLCETGYADITFIDSDGIQRDTSVTLEEFQQNSEHLIREALQVVDEAIRNARAAHPEFVLDRVCLAGGSSKMPAIKKSLSRHIPDVRVDLCDPDQAIAKGAARYANSLVGGNGNYDITIEERGHAYGILGSDSQNRKVVKNIIRRSDPTVIDERVFCQYMPNESDRLHICIIESNVGKNSFVYRGQTEFFSDDVKFPYVIPVGTQIDFRLSRDSDGLVHLSVSHNGDSQSFDFATKVSGVSDLIRSRVQSHISKMSNNQ